ncbi:OLC1v1026378C3 [Oldenlandia corymbosa var. corymbosa]|nr:OLC1v1026378C3 [Oldenlandia corymbosa var. corymbosa]
MVDRKRALISRLLQYALVHKVLGIPFHEIIIKRTVEGKPYLEYDDQTCGFPNFNFNTSHDGDYVGIASEPVCLVGIDIATHSSPMKDSVEDFIQNFAIYFSNLEWSDIVKSDSSTKKLNVFYRYWCLKESFAKALGTGVGNRMDNVEFHHSSWEDLYVVVDGKELKDWRFWLLEVEKDHLISIARGNPAAATTSYRKTLKQTDFGEKEYSLALNHPNVPLMFRHVEDLLPFPTVSPGINMDVSTELKTTEDEKLVERQLPK